MDWADELAAKVEGPQVVNDSKTPSGTVHVGSLRGPVILDVIARALRSRGLRRRSSTASTTWIRWTPRRS
jgi:lysyl-tRNA synthetase, class I